MKRTRESSWRLTKSPRLPSRSFAGIGHRSNSRWNASRALTSSCDASELTRMSCPTSSLMDDPNRETAYRRLTDVYRLPARQALQRLRRNIPDSSVLHFWVGAAGVPLARELEDRKAE